MKVITLIFFIQFTILLSIFGQVNNIGIPPIRNYQKEIYQAGTQSWGITQDQRGMVYFANNEGLLEFDGMNWRVYPISNHTICRSLAINKAGKIYVGAQGEFGCFQPDEQGTLEYHSLIHLIPEEHRNFEDVWDIIIHEEGLFFRTTRNIFQLKDETIKVYDLEYELLFLGMAHNTIFIQTTKGQVFKFEKNQFVPTFETDLEIGLITDIIPLDDRRLLIATLKNAFFTAEGNAINRFRTPIDAFLRKSRMLCAAETTAKEFVIGTSLGGILVMNQKGKVIRHLQKSNGLQNNMVNHIYVDHADNIWLGLNHGIDYIELSSPFTKIYPDGNQEGSVYAAKIYQDHLYLGTSNGLYRIPWQSYYDPFKDHQFELVKNTTGQVWGLDVIDDQLLIGHHEGALVLKNNTARPLSNATGSWTFLPMGDNWMIEGCYTGFNLYQQKKGQWVYHSALKGLEESSRLVAKDKDNQIWMAHPYRGVFKIQWKQESDSIQVNHYTSKDGLGSDLFSHVFTVNEKMIFASETGVYQYDESTDRFSAATSFNNILGEDVRVKQLQEDQKGNVWFAANDEVGLIDVQLEGLNKNIQKVLFPKLSGKLLGGFELIYPIDEQNVLFGADKGAYHFDPSKNNKIDTSLQVFLTSVYGIVKKDSLINGGNFSKNGQIVFEQPASQVLVFPSNLNAFRFSFSSNFHQDIQAVHYQHYLKGLEREWSPWSHKTEKEYTNLSPGEYTFYIRAMDHFGKTSNVKKYTFQISAPWYANTIAYIFYGLILIGLIAASFLFQRKNFTKERDELQSKQKQLEEQHQQEVAESEKAIIELKNVNLKSEIQFKNKELASTTMHLVQKVEMLKKIQGELKKVISSKQDIDTIKKEINRMIRLLNADEQLDNEWSQFAHHFDEVHRNFLKRISEKYPQLRPNDHRLCAYLRMNLSTKEIAHLLNLSVRGVEASRYRLRKKINLSSEINLTEFMMKF